MYIRDMSFIFTYYYLLFDCFVNYWNWPCRQRYPQWKFFFINSLFFLEWHGLCLCWLDRDVAMSVPGPGDHDHGHSGQHDHTWAWGIEWVWVGGYSAAATTIILLNFMLFISIIRNRYLHYSFNYVVFALSFR